MAVQETGRSRSPDDGDGTMRNSSQTKEEEGNEINKEDSSVSPDSEEKQEQESGEASEEEESAAPPLPNEEAPPLPNEAPPGQPPDDGWDPIWDDNAQAFYFFNRFTGVSQWENPRVRAPEAGPPGVDIPAASHHSPSTEPPPARQTNGYNPAIHGDYDPNADYAQEQQKGDEGSQQQGDPNMIYTATGAFNRFTGKWQAASLTPDNFNDENKSKRQMNAFFDVDAAANSHDGKSLRAERSGKKLTKQELKAFKEKRRERKEEKRRAWLRD